MTQVTPAKNKELSGVWPAFVHPQRHCIQLVVGYTYRTTHPLQGHSVGCCLGRKNRLLGGFFISRPGKVL
jgi:hypothetical protein